jgi:predicted  nucleic acid-binding Zn-ribbon protein
VSEDLDHLLVVGDLDTSITQLEHRRAGLAAKIGLTALEATMAALDVEVAAATARRAALLATQKDLEAQIATVNERRTGIEQRMYAATGSSTRDLQAMSEEVKHLGERRAELEELELVAMVDQEPIDAELATLAATRAPMDDEAATMRAQVAQDAAEIDAELAVATSTRASEAALLPAALAARYETLRTRLKGSGVARLVGHQCGGCHLELSSGEIERIKAQAPDTVVTCDQCGRILVPT